MLLVVLVWREGGSWAWSQTLQGPLWSARPARPAPAARALPASRRPDAASPLAEGPASHSLGAVFRHWCAAREGLRHQPLAAASRRRTGQGPCVPRAAPGGVHARGGRGRGAPTGAREPRGLHPGARKPGGCLSLGGGTDSRALVATCRAETPRDWTCPAPHPKLVLRSGRRPRSSSSLSRAQLCPGPSLSSPAPRSRGCREPLPCSGP